MRAALLLMLVPCAALAMGPFEKNHPLVDKGTDAFNGGRFEEALGDFDAAAKERPKDHRVQYNRAVALHKLGRNPEARQALSQADEFDEAHELSAKIHYTLGNIAAADGDPKAAIKEYRKSLKADPNDGFARHNLEVLLRNLPPKQNSGADGGTPDGGRSDAGTRPDAGQDGGAHPDSGVDAGTPDGGPNDGGQQDGGQTPDGGQDGGADGGPPQDGGQGDGGKGDAGQGEKEKPGDAGEGGQGRRGDTGADGGADQHDAGQAEEAEPVEAGDGGAQTEKRDAEKLLDSLKNNEKNLQLWRFRQKTQRNDTHGKDW